MPRIREVRYYRVDITAEEMRLLTQKLSIARRNDDDDGAESIALYSSFGVPDARSQTNQEPTEDEVESLAEKALRISGVTRTAGARRRKSVLTRPLED